MKTPYPQVVPAEFAMIFRRVIAQVTRVYPVQESDLLGTSRVHRIVTARMVAMVMLRVHSTATLAEVGQCFGRDHSTVGHAQRVVAEWCETEPRERDRVEVVRKAIQEEASTDNLAPEEYIAKLLASYDELEAKVRQLGALIEVVRLTELASRIDAWNEKNATDLSGRVEAGK